ncbi:hypothetical protein LFZ31_09970, partial [Salmonella enterica subsp. enterica serovar Newport str. S09097]
FQHFANNFRNTGRRQLRQTRQVNSRYRSELINQAIQCSGIGLLNLNRYAQADYQQTTAHSLYFRAPK